MNKNVSLAIEKAVSNLDKIENNDLKDLNSNGVEVSSVSASKPTLDDVFLEVTGYRLEGSEDIKKEEEICF